MIKLHTHTDLGAVYHCHLELETHTADNGGLHFTASLWSVRHKLSLSFSNVLSLSPSMPPFIPVDTGYSLGHHCVGIQVANGNSPIVSPTLSLCAFCPYIWSTEEKWSREWATESVKLVTQIPPSTSAPPVGGAESVARWAYCVWNGLWGEFAGGQRVALCQNSWSNHILFSLKASLSFLLSY